ncbi:MULTISPECIES: hypothetical protein [unclassified Bradyrhizobium]|uniref:hypothetical protein n=1 Tax=unclassified Bradyrhizobium TaxID=2631580 RepID=UPI0020B2F8BC|nr:MULTISPECIES: hypothetical protein [unclassified Bradyrhizobium]MCP3383031.1 hypothetical protein [Bradyrhizobium sp. CCGUVB4N]MCP3444087.1 hypothetical protein [Bradyrhizobium sp. CCGUVB14]
MRLMLPVVAAAVLATSAPALAVDQTVLGAGNAAAGELAARSPLVTSALARIEQVIATIDDAKLKAATRDALFNPNTCVAHRANLTASDKEKIIAELTSQGLINEANGKAFPGGAVTGVFPPLRDDGTACPHLPMAWGAAPGGAFAGHHSYPGGLPVHESFNLASAISLSENYRLTVGLTGEDGLPRVAPLPSSRDAVNRSDLVMNNDAIIAAPMLHDWAKPIVFQWNADGSEFAEFNFGGNGETDADGAKGDSRTGAHHILGVAESMARDLPAPFIVIQASAHTAPTLGKEYMAVNWLRAAAIIAHVDPIARGYLVKDADGHFRLPPARTTDNIDFLAAKIGNLSAETVIHNLSDADYIFTGPAVTASVAILTKLAPDYGFDPADAAKFNNGFRNPALSYLSAERILIRYNHDGLTGVRRDLDALKKAKAI